MKLIKDSRKEWTKGSHKEKGLALIGSMDGNPIEPEEKSECVL